jgi:hypothetical protein
MLSQSAARPALLRAMNHACQHMAAPGAWLDGAQRQELVLAARGAWLGEEVDHGLHDERERSTFGPHGGALLEAFAQLAARPGSLDRGWFERATLLGGIEEDDRVARREAMAVFAEGLAVSAAAVGAEALHELAGWAPRGPLPLQHGSGSLEGGMLPSSLLADQRAELLPRELCWLPLLEGGEAGLGAATAPLPLLALSLVPQEQAALRVWTGQLHPLAPAAAAGTAAAAAGAGALSAEQAALLALRAAEHSGCCYTAATHAVALGVELGVELGAAGNSGPTVPVAGGGAAAGAAAAAAAVERAAGGVAAGSALLAFVDAYARVTAARQQPDGGGEGEEGEGEGQLDGWDAYGEAYDRAATEEAVALDAAREALLAQMLALHGGCEHTAMGATLDAAGVVAAAHVVDRICCGTGLTADSARSRRTSVW